MSHRINAMSHRINAMSQWNKTSQRTHYAFEAQPLNNGVKHKNISLKIINSKKLFIFAN